MSNNIETLKAYSKLVEMDMHEQTNFDDYDILRVPGGWIYSRTEENYGAGGINVSSTFVPLVQGPQI